MRKLLSHTVMDLEGLDWVCFLGAQHKAGVFYLYSCLSLHNGNCLAFNFKLFFFSKTTASLISGSVACELCFHQLSMHRYYQLSIYRQRTFCITRKKLFHRKDLHRQLT